MKIFKCTKLTNWLTPCACEYREVSDGKWEYRYTGSEPDPMAHREWEPISATSIVEIEDMGHRVIEMPDEEWSDPREDIQDMVKLAVCPKCSAEYPDFHSPIGSLGTLCDTCGWSSEEEVKSND